MRTLLICHDDAPLDREGLARWLASFSTFAGTVVVHEPRSSVWRRVRRQWKRVGSLRMLDVLAFRAAHRLIWSAADRRWESGALRHMRDRFPGRVDAPSLVAQSPNAPDAQEFIRDRQPDLIIARCKALLKPAVFEVPRLGTFVMHPGICPEYRNSHGCFWAMANGDPANVGMTLLRIDRGIDTGPVFAHFFVSANPSLESHVVTQQRAVLDHLDGLRRTLLAIEAGTARPIDTSGRRSAEWGQPWLTAYLRWRLCPR